MKKLIGAASIAAAVLAGAYSYTKFATTSGSENQAAINDQLALQVYKSPTCGCCNAWIEHLEKSNFKVTATNLSDLEGIKDQYGVGPQYRSCHTGVSTDGYAFEGHVPAKYIAKFLSEKPQGAIGLSVPAMPVGSPGMEVGDKFMPYQVLLLKQDGSAEVYADVTSYAAQF